MYLSLKRTGNCKRKGEESTSNTWLFGVRKGDIFEEKVTIKNFQSHNKEVVGKTCERILHK